MLYYELLKLKTTLHYIQVFRPYLAVNTFRLSYKNSSNNVIWGNNHCLFWDSYTTHKNTVYAEGRTLNEKTVGAWSKKLRQCELSKQKSWIFNRVQWRKRYPWAYSYTHFDTRNQMKLTGEVNLPAALVPGKQSLTPIEYVAGRIPEPVWTFWTRSISFMPAGNRTTVLSTPSPQPIAVLDVISLLSQHILLMLNCPQLCI
jgi:hypothetical protein